MGRDISCLKGKRIDEMRRIPVGAIVLVSSVSVFNLATPARAASDPVCLTGGSDNALRCGAHFRADDDAPDRELCLCLSSL